MRHSVAKAELFVTQGFTWGDTGSGRRQNQAPGGRKGSSNNDKWICSYSTIAHALHGLPNHPARWLRNHPFVAFANAALSDTAGVATGQE